MMEKKGRKEGTEAHRKRQSGTQKYSKQNIFLNKKKRLILVYYIIQF